MSDRVAVRVRGVSKAFRIPTVRRDTVREHVLGALRPRRFERLQVLDDVSFDIERGDTVGIMGRNGCGKSTLLKILCHIYAPDRGRVDVSARLTPILELGVGWNPELDAIDNVLLIGSVMGLALPQIKRSMDEILHFADVERFANLKLKHYSTGMASRLAYAVAFQAVGEILVLDEIFAVGDMGFRERCQDRYRELARQGHTVIVVSHEPAVVAGFCRRALLIEGGRIAMDGKPADVVQRYLAVVNQPAEPARQAG